MTVCTDVVSHLPIPRPFTLESFVRRLSQRRGRPIELVASWLGPSAPCGLLVSTDDIDYVCYASNTSPLHQLHIILHEIGHLELGHERRQITMPSLVGRDRHPPRTDDQVPTGRDDSLKALLPRLSPQLIRRLLGRTAYVDVDERAAELFATLAGDRISRVPSLAGGVLPGDLGVRGLDSLFGGPAQRDDLSG